MTLLLTQDQIVDIEQVTNCTYSSWFWKNHLKYYVKVKRSIRCTCTVGQKDHSLGQAQKENAFILLQSTPKTWNSMNCGTVS